MSPAVPKPTKAPKVKREPRAKKESSPLEEMEQIALASWLDYNRILWCHVPNGGMRHPVVAQRMKRMGVKPGVPDILIFDSPPNAVPTPGTGIAKRVVGVAIELKRIGGDGPRPEQREWLAALDRNGWLSYVAYGADDAIALLKNLGYPIIGKVRRSS